RRHVRGSSRLSCFPVPPRLVDLLTLQYATLIGTGSVRDRGFDLVDDQHLDRTRLRFELQPELLLQRGEERQPITWNSRLARESRRAGCCGYLGLKLDVIRPG